MDHRIDSLLAKHIGQQRFVADIALDKGGLFTAQAGDDRQDTLLTVAEVVENNDVVTVL